MDTNENNVTVTLSGASISGEKAVDDQTSEQMDKIIDDPVITEPKKPVSSEDKSKVESLADLLNKDNEAADAPDFDENYPFFCIPAGPYTAMMERFKRFIDARARDTGKELDINDFNLAKPVTYADMLLLTSIRNMSNDQMVVGQDMLDEFVSKNDLVANSNDKVFMSLSSAVTTKDNSKRILSGKEAASAFMAKLGGYLRVPLLNSGFTVDIRAMPMVEIDNLYLMLEAHQSEYGSYFGAPYYMYHGLEITKTIISKIHEYIVDSSLKGWDKKSTFEEAFQLQDYDHLLNAMAYLMHRKGIDITFVCVSNTECDFHEVVHTDISKLAIHNFNALPDECAEFLMSDKPKSLKDLEAYRRRLNLDSSFEFNDITVFMQAPSLKTYFEFGNKFNTEILSMNRETKSAVVRLIELQAFKIFTPWISEIRTTDENGHTIRGTGSDIISEVLKMYSGDKIKFAEQVQKFIKSSKLSQIAYQFSKCPKCNHVTPNQGYLSFDVQKAFFTMLQIRSVLNT